MFESFVIMLREGVEMALVIGIILAVLRQSNQRHLERPVFWGVGAAIVASIIAAIVLHAFQLKDEIYEGTLYWLSAAFVISMMVWMHRKAKTLRRDIQQRVEKIAETKSSRREAWALGAFAFLMIFREGAETVMFLSAVNLTANALLSFIGTVLGLVVAIAFGVMFVRGSLHVNLRRFFNVTTWVLGIFVAQLILNGFHEFMEAGIIPENKFTGPLLDSVVRHNSLFILAIVAIPLFIWISGLKKSASAPTLSGPELQVALAQARRGRFYTAATIAITVVILTTVGLLYARELAAKTPPSSEQSEIKTTHLGTTN